MSRDERGQVTVMIVGFFLIAALLVVVVVNASAAYQRRQAFNNLADGAALAAADGVQGEQVYSGGLGADAPIDPAVARRLVGEYLQSSGALAGYPGLSWSVTAQGAEVRVRLSGPIDLPLRPPGWDTDARVAAEAAVRVRVSAGSSVAPR